MPFPLLIPVVIGGAGLAAVGAKKLYNKIKLDTEKDNALYEEEKEYIGDNITYYYNKYDIEKIPFIMVKSKDQYNFRFDLLYNFRVSNIELYMIVHKRKNLIVKSSKMKYKIYKIFSSLANSMKYVCNRPLFEDYIRLLDGWTKPKLYSSDFDFSFIQKSFFDFLSQDESQYSSDSEPFFYNSQISFDIYDHMDNDISESEIYLIQDLFSDSQVYSLLALKENYI